MPEDHFDEEKRMSDLTQFERIRIQMEAVVPLLKEFQAVFGEEAVIDLLEQRARRREESVDSATTPDFSRMVAGAEFFAAGGALDYEIIAADTDRFDMNVTRCRYAEMMDELGGRAFGHLLVCRGDFAAAKRIGMTLTRTQTRMQGADYCDFRYRPAEDASGS